MDFKWLNWWLSLAVGEVSFLSDKPLDFHDTIFSVSPSLFKV